MDGLKEKGVRIVTEKAPGQRNRRAPGEEVLTAVLTLPAECAGIAGGVPPSKCLEVVRHGFGGDCEVL